jgi:hypothetical protein
VFLTKIFVEQKGWLMQSAPYVNDRGHSLYFLESLDTLADKNPEAVADVYIKMLARDLPTHRQENIRSIVEKLYRAGLRDKANDISNEYAHKDYPNLLRDLYERYNSPIRQ